MTALRKVGNIAGILAVMLLVGTFLGAVMISSTQAQRSIRADTSAVVVMVNNGTILPIQVGIATMPDSVISGFRRWCPPKHSCIYIVPSVELGAAPAFLVGARPYGSETWDVSNVWERVPGQENVVQLNLQERPPEAVRAPPSQVSAPRFCDEC